jgi:hypothetical protein
LLLVTWWCGRRRNSDVLLAELQLASEAHDDDNRLGVVDLDIEAKKPGDEGLDPLRLRKRAHVGEQGLKLVLVVADRAGLFAGHELTQWVERIGGPKWGLRSSVKWRQDGPHLGASF